MKSFRGLRYFLAPPWLTGKGDGEKVAFTLEWLMDAFLERLRQGLNARFPSRAGESALGLIIGDRGLLRGRSETAAAVATRLKAWRTPRTHLVRGNAYEALLQIWHYWGGIYAATIDSHGLRHQIEADDSPDVDTLPDPDSVASSWLWQFDLAEGPANTVTSWGRLNADTHWSRFWVVLQPTAAMGVGAQPDFGDADLWGGALGTPGYTLGQTGVTPEDVTAMRALFQELAWNPRHTQPEWVVVCLDPNTANPIPVPDLNWKYWSKDDGSGTRVSARVPSLVFTHGDNSSRIGPGSVTIDMPESLAGGELLLLHEVRQGGALDTITGWTQITSRAGPFGESTRLLARIATSSEPPDFSHTVTGGAADRVHLFKVTAVSGAVWSDTIADNFTVGSTSASFSASPIADPDNADETHRLNMIALSTVPAGVTVSGSDYAELYDVSAANGGFGVTLAMSSHVGALTGSETTFSDTHPWMQMSVTLEYALALRFWSLDPVHNNTYAGDRGREWPAAAESDALGTFTGDRSNAAAFGAFALSGSALNTAGTRTRFPGRVLQLDDGSIPK